MDSYPSVLLVELGQMKQLFAHHSGTADRATEDALVNNRYDLRRIVAGEALLSSQPRQDAILDFRTINTAVTAEDGASVRLDLE